MRLITSTFLVVYTLIGIVLAQNDAATQEQLLATLHQMYAAEKNHDLAAIRSHVSDDFAEAAGDGSLYHWKDVEAGFADLQLHTYQLSDCTTRVIGTGAAYMSCRMEMDASYRGTALPRLMRVTWVWSRTKDRWVVRFEQATVVTAPSAKSANLPSLPCSHFQ